MLNKLIIKTMPLVPKPVIYMFAKKYIAGPKLEDAVRVTKELMAEGGMSTIDVLGEFVETKERAIHEKEMSKNVLDAISEHNLESYLSIKPTSVGLGIDEEFAFENVSELVSKARDLGLRVRIDMENSPYTTKTLKLYKRIRDAGYDNVGFVIQAYMKRSEDDIKSLLEYKPNVRLCKGIYVESPEIAYRDFKAVQENFKKLLRVLVEGGAYPAIATHDDDLLNDAEMYIKEKGMAREDYEFQMLLGVKDNKRAELISHGHRMRVYVPYGEDWYGYSFRRLKENPKMVNHIVKSIFTSE